MKQQKAYGNESISSLKGADRVRLRPAVIFGSDGLEGCEHAVFEILSNAIDEAREGYGRQILVTRYEDHSIEVEDFGRGCPVDWNEKEGKYNWELVFCELYAGGKYQNNTGGDYEFSLGLNGLGSCATQYSSEYFDAIIRRDGFKYTLHFEKGELVGKMKKEPTDRKATGSIFRWKPDLAVFTDIDIPKEYFEDTLKRQAVVNAGVTFTFRDQENGKFVKTDYCYPNGILDYVNEIAGEQTLTMPQFWEAERKGRDRADKPEYRVKLNVAMCVSNKHNLLEYYHNSSWLEHGGSASSGATPTDAAALASVASVLNGACSLPFWGGLVLVGLVAPFAIEAVLARCNASKDVAEASLASRALLASAGCVLVGGACLRAVVVAAGMLPVVSVPF